jgi:uncharacterized membrane protein
VRQLQNVVEQACALATTPLIPRALVDRALRVKPMEALGYAEAKQRFERNYLVQLLKLTAGNVSDAARIAGRNRTEFYRLLQRCGLDPVPFRGDAAQPHRVLSPAAALRSRPCAVPRRCERRCDRATGIGPVEPCFCPGCRRACRHGTTAFTLRRIHLFEKHEKELLVRPVLMSEQDARSARSRHRKRRRIMINRQTIATVITTTAIAYSICSPTQAANLAAQAQAKPREPVTSDVDRNLQNDVKAALGADAALDGSYVAVTSRSGTVTLSGVVRSAEQLARVLQTTMSVTGVRHIDNALEVDNPAELSGSVQGTR